jgi:UPF0716 protein FxsA
MPVLLVLLFIGVPLLELVVILQVGAAIGGWLTAGILIVDSIVGAILLRVEGRRAWSDFRLALSEGRWPGDEVAQGALIIVGGTLLVTPGFITDIVGFLLLLAPSRRLVAGGVRRRVGKSGAATGGAGPAGSFGPFGPDGDPRAASGAASDAGASSGRGRGRGSRGRSSRRRSDGHDEVSVELDVEVVEIRREQGPRHLTGGEAETFDPHDDVDGDDPRR